MRIQQDLNEPFCRGGVGVEVLEVFWEELSLHFFWPTFWLHCILYRTYAGGEAPPISKYKVQCHKLAPKNIKTKLVKLVGLGLLLRRIIDDCHGLPALACPCPSAEALPALLPWLTYHL